MFNTLVGRSAVDSAIFAELPKLDLVLCLTEALCISVRSTERS